MKLRYLIVAGLVIAVAVVVVAQIVKEPRAQPDTASAGPKSPPVATAPHKVIAYYFHRTVRCDTCRIIEAQAQAVIDAEFADMLRAGLLEWRAINIEEAGNEHYAAAYDLTTPALVLAETADGRPARWSKLNRVWELVQNPPAFTQYVQDELRGYISSL